MNEPARPTDDVPPVIVTAPLVNKLVFGPLALIFGILFLTPFWYAVEKGDWKAPGDGDVTVTVIGYLITSVLAALCLVTVPFLLTFRVELWPDRIRKRILVGFSTMRIADARHVTMTPRKVNARTVVAEKWFVTGSNTRGGRFRVTIDLGLTGDIPEAKAVMKRWIAERPDLEPSLFGRTSTQIHPEV